MPSESNLIFNFGQPGSVGARPTIPNYITSNAGSITPADLGDSSDSKASKTPFAPGSDAFGIFRVNVNTRDNSTSHASSLITNLVANPNPSSFQSLTNFKLRQLHPPSTVFAPQFEDTYSLTPVVHGGDPFGFKPVTISFKVFSQSINRGDNDVTSPDAYLKSQEKTESKISRASATRKLRGFTF